MPRTGGIPLIRAFCLLALSAGASAQTTWYVDDDGTPPGTGTQNDPYTRIQFAIDQAATHDGDTIEVLPGTYVECVIYRSKDLRIQSSGGAAVTFIDAQGKGTTVTIDGGQGPGTSLEGFTILGGVGTDLVNGDVVGGGILCSGVEALIEGCVIDGCGATDAGGGLYADDSTLVVLDTVFQDCEPGGGLHAQDCTVTIEGCDFVANERFNLLFEAASGLTLLDCASSIIWS